jgi:hypothetical protein
VDSAPATRRHGVNFQSLWGILVTTSGFGKASFDFANDKPLELLFGTNLLYLLKEHAQVEPPEHWVEPKHDTGPMHWDEPSSGCRAAVTCEHRRSRRPCHLRAIRSGHERYPADSHGHFEEAAGLAARL